MNRDRLDGHMKTTKNRTKFLALNGTDHRSHEERNSMIRRYIAWRNRHTDDEALRVVSKRAKVV
jgi:hypothetical protein